MARSKHDEDNPINLLKRIKVLEDKQKRLENLIHIIFEAKSLYIDVSMDMDLWDTINKFREEYKD